MERKRLEAPSWTPPEPAVCLSAQCCVSLLCDFALVYLLAPTVCQSVAAKGRLSRKIAALPAHVFQSPPPGHPGCVPCSPLPPGDDLILAEQGACMRRGAGSRMYLALPTTLVTCQLLNFHFKGGLVRKLQCAARSLSSICAACMLRRSMCFVCGQSRKHMVWSSGLLHHAGIGTGPPVNCSAHRF